jgi:hypothetical protein
VFNPREAVRYGNCSIVHPVRGPIEITDDSRKSVIAPLYGGPVFKEPTKDAVVLRYKSFTSETEFQLDGAKAEEMIIDRPAVLRIVHGDGNLFGPHLEHPRYPQANNLFLRLLGYDGSNQPDRNAPPIPETPMRAELHRSISDVKVAIHGLENRSFTVGHKAWDGSRLLEIVSAVDKRGWTLSDTTSKLIASDLGRAGDSNEITSLLVGAARTCVDNHFAVLSNRVGKSSGDAFSDSC